MDVAHNNITPPLEDLVFAVRANSIMPIHRIGVAIVDGAQKILGVLIVQLSAAYNVKILSRENKRRKLINKVFQRRASMLTVCTHKQLLGTKCAVTFCM